MSSPLNLTGKRFARLQVVRRAASNRAGNTQWECQCDCGAVAIVLGYRLITGNTQSCGCLKRDRTSARMQELKTTHGRSKTRAYASWKGMLSRCTNPLDPKYPLYGARSIAICQRWLDFKNFFADMGERERGQSIERNNNDGNYEPGNCRWASAKEQANNTRHNRRLTHNGETLTLTEWANKLGITPGTLHERLLKHSTEKSLTMRRKRYERKK